MTILHPDPQQRCVKVNQYGVLDHDDQQLVLAGVADYGAHQFSEHQRSDPVAALTGVAATAAPKILLAHQPRSDRLLGAAEAFRRAVGDHPHRLVP